MAQPPYWPFRCGTCSRFVSNPRCFHNSEHITGEFGDCSRCGPGVKLAPGLAWEDWFTEDYVPAGDIAGAEA